MGSRHFVEDHCGEVRFAAAIITDLVGPVAITGLRALGIELPGTRAELDRFVTNPAVCNLLISSLGVAEEPWIHF